VKPSKVVNIAFEKPALKKRHCVYEDNVSNKRTPAIPTLNDDEKKNILVAFKEATETSHIHTMISDSEETDSADCSEEDMENSVDTLLALTTKSIYIDVLVGEELTCKISSEQAKVIEEKTKGQSECQARRNQRKGRITASYFGRVCKVKSGVDRLVCDILGESTAPQGLPSLQWGSRKEKEALIA
ncbi:hypothetical protein JTE90_028987, partial [Oedothorax gibbosus]